MEDLPTLRQKLDTIDNEILELLAKRFEITHRVGLYKKQHDLPVRDLSREEAMFERMRKLSREHNLDPDFTVELYKRIIDEVVKNHEVLRNE